MFVSDSIIFYKNRFTEHKFSFNDAAAQAFVFFLAGFETSSTTMMFAFYELAMNPDVQRRLQQEIDRVLEKSDNRLTYDSVAEMEYLDWLVQGLFSFHSIFYQSKDIA